MDALNPFFELVKKKALARGNLLGFLFVLIGRRIVNSKGETVSAGMTWRELSDWLKKIRWEPDAVRELGLSSDDLPPRDRQRYWYSVIARAGIDSPKAKLAGERFAEVLGQHGYQVE
ncbi:MAG: hypothetical protein L0Y72_25945 [Gemmataceae bacterium]|nr:hypothetical protein [Gemmataceae bacterium]MCI0742490.1 hypothetical protein [Gemmataceae bacterium]